MLDEDGFPFLTEPEPFPYRDEPDNSTHFVTEGDTLWGIAHFKFAGYPRPCGLWWIIGHFQPVPIIDPTIALKAGTILFIPSARLVRMALFNPSRRRDH
jgi:hypothetical protein